MNTNAAAGLPGPEIVKERLARMRAALQQRGAQALVVTSADPHLSEYLPAHWQAREWLSGFTGSMGTLVLTLEHAALFADSRYWVQAERELAGSDIALEKLANGAAPAHHDWLVAQVPPGGRVLCDGDCLGLAAGRALSAALTRAGLVLELADDPIAAVWSDRPPLPAAPIYAHPEPCRVRSCEDTLRNLRAAMANQRASHHFVSSLDDIAFITGLRGADVPYNPVFLAHLLIDETQACLFVNSSRIPADLLAHLAAQGVQVAPYASAGEALASLPPTARLLLDPRRTAWGLHARVAAGVTLLEATNPSTLLKSRKNASEVEFIRVTMEEDGAAMCEFYAEFEAALGKLPLTELSVDEHLSAARARRPGFVSLSFPTIAAWNANGAMPHYRATEAAHSVIDGNGLLLIDSGGQYHGGTTDITRVWAIGEPSAAMRRDYTLVFKGMQALSRTRFPRGTLAPMLDSIARAPLWAEGLDYGHGTGHGVGYFLNVHEGPQSISKAIPEAVMALEPGMVTSNEPGVYRARQWGIRIENLLLCRTCDTRENDAFGEMLEFETLTLCPIDTRCLDLSLLRADEIAWLDAYHLDVRTRLAPRLGGDALAWLLARTAPLARES
jgi:Xaa-Pro aminopeptidase